MERSASRAQPPELCRPFLDALPVAGAAVAVIVPSGGHLTLCSSDELAARIDELQSDLGEGPQWEVARTGRIVTIPDVSAAGHEAWPMLAAALAGLPIGSVFSIPIRMGAVTVGVVTLYSERPRELDADQRTTALAIGAVIAGTVVQQGIASALDDRAGESAATPALRREVHQATGMVVVQADVSATDAYARLQAYAFASGRTVQDVAHDVVAGILSFEDPS